MTSILGNPLSTRTLVRGDTARFEALFVDADGVTPLVPIDPASYPAVSITDAEGVIVESGVGASMGDGRWVFQCLLPADSVLSTDATPWRINWTMVIAGGRQVESEQVFAVTDALSLTPNDRAYTHLVPLGFPDRLMVKFRTAQSVVKLILVDSAGEALDMSSQVANASVDGWNVYYVDTPPWVVVGQYKAMWSCTPSAALPPQVIVQTIRIPPMSFWDFQPSLRMLIDKSQKKSGHVQAYSDSDMYEYMLMGTQILNGYTPTTYLTFDQMTTVGPLQPLLVIASAWYGLGAQFLSEVDLQFSFSGQTTTLDRDITSGIDAMRASLKDYLSEQAPVVKKNLNRQGYAGAAAIRPISYRQGPWMTQMTGARGQLPPDQMIPLGRLGFLTTG